MEVAVLATHLIICSCLFYGALVLHRITNNLKKEVKPPEKKKRQRKAKTLNEVRETVYDMGIFDEQN